MMVAFHWLEYRNRKTETMELSVTLNEDAFSMWKKEGTVLLRIYNSLLLPMSTVINKTSFSNFIQLNQNLSEIECFGLDL